jgi:hypothetical protein
LRRDVGERIKETPAVWRRTRNFRGGDRKCGAGDRRHFFEYINPTMRLPAS